MLKFLSDAVEVKDHLCQCVTNCSLLPRCHADRQRLQKCAFVVESCSYSIQSSILSLLSFSFHLFNSTHCKIVFDLKVLISYFVTVCLHRRSFKNRNNNWSVESLEKNFNKGDARLERRIGNLKNEIKVETVPPEFKSQSSEGTRIILKIFLPASNKIEFSTILFWFDIQ